MDGMMAGVMKGAASDFLHSTRDWRTWPVSRRLMHIAYKSNSICMQYVQTKDFSCECQVFRLDVMYAPPRKLWCSIGMIRTSPQSTHPDNENSHQYEHQMIT